MSDARKMDDLAMTDKLDLLGLTGELCSFVTNVVADENEDLFSRLKQELPFRLHRYASREEHNGWVVPPNWRVERAEISRDGSTVFDATVHSLGVAMLSDCFQGELELDELQDHLVSNPAQPDAIMYHSIWQIRNWDTDWSISIPHAVRETLSPGKYRVDLVTTKSDGEMIVGECEIKGRSDKVILFNANNCHPGQANDGFAAVALLVRLFQWLSKRDNYYTYRLIIAPEHLGSVFYMRDKSSDEISRMSACVFMEMPAVNEKITVTRSFLGGQDIDVAFANACRHYCKNYSLAGWRQGVGNDETVWEAPGYEIPTVEVTRSANSNQPYPEYHSSLDNPDLVDTGLAEEVFELLQRVIVTLEENCVAKRHFNGLICLSNPRYGLYRERFDPAIDKGLTVDDEKWGQFQDSLPRYLEGQMTVLEMAAHHDLPFQAVRRYLEDFDAKQLVTLSMQPMQRRTPTQKHER